jgi:hypothetical protein
MKIHRLATAPLSVAIILLTLGTICFGQKQRALDGLIYSPNAPFCVDRFRSVDGTNFIDLLPLFRQLTNYYSADRPLRPWRAIAGRVVSLPREGSTDQRGIIVQVDTLESDPELRDVIHLTGFPTEHQLTDRKYIHAIAKLTGRYQYRTVGGGLATVPSYSYGQLPTLEQHQAITARIMSNYYARVQAAKTTRAKTK